MSLIFFIKRNSTTYGAKNRGGPHFKNFVDLLKDLLAMALANGLLRRGLPAASNLIPDQKVWLCVFAEDSNQDDFVKAVKSSCEGFHVKYLTIASAKTLGQWSLVSKNNFP
ncbi:putative ribosomal protein S12e [Rosa chinensis]|uniref:Putative ribosomal protein S12e n=1 Tax=Rosa chinensis TaxID=74649 RepID=A0A2P6QPU5_ROSCH|nr:putative ribosomal protein S12e [Rosa chinensis]